MSDDEYASKYKSVIKQLYTRLKQENLDVSKFKDFPIYLEKDTTGKIARVYDDASRQATFIYNQK